ncbi:AAA family ATPase [Heliorestis acidaminivorans]|uniref:endopeptidase La n=1 Tax=Heliorestis acidaminivorans TaxID=553427 RepID=A0A6I0EQU5_9FIRM|nr:ATP-binding protein [Heliorestis acidaminivorans]KAB2952596.1 AAA family ATPase [Heliorestis acidaminivorans]
MAKIRGSNSIYRVERRLASQNLSAHIEPHRFNFSSTEELDSSATPLIGQDRAIRALDFGVAIKNHGFNIFITGPVGSGKIDFALDRLKEKAEQGDVPPDLLFVYNFQEPSKPSLITLPAGMGKEFRDDIAWLTDEMGKEVRKAFENENFEEQKNAYLQQVEAKLSEAFQEMEQKAKLEGFVLQKSSNGIFTIPINHAGKAMTKEEFETLEEEERQAITERERNLESQLAHIVRRTRNLQKETSGHLSDMEKETAKQATSRLLELLVEKYNDQEKVKAYLFAFQEDMIQHLDDLKSVHSDDETVELPLSMSALRKMGKKDTTSRYEVNIFVEQKHQQGSPVIVEMNPTYANLFGKLEYSSSFGSFVTDFTMFKAGAIHYANGGYLILPVKELLTAPGAWESLKRVLKKREMIIENLSNQLGLSLTATIKPEALPIQVKVILIGHPKLYHLLYQLDEDFRKLFKVPVDFASFVERNEITVDQYAIYVSSVCKREGLLPFDSAAVAVVINYASRLAGHQRKLSVNMEALKDLLVQASLWAQLDGADLVTAEYVHKAVEEKIYRVSRLEEQVRELMQEGTIMIDTEGAVMGQVNGLALMHVGDHLFGKPSRITATIYMGRSGIVNIERETQMSGQSHSKGIMILSSFFASRFAKERPLAFSGTLTFEQLYEGVDGDSASSAELYALMSAIAEVPIDQSIAVTGSVNQKGEIQPIGGVNEKIESFFRLCEQRGLRGDEGVIIPVQNKAHLMLHRDVIKAVEEERFHIYGVKNIDEGMEILTGLEAGTASTDGTYPDDTINGMVAQKLQALNDKWRKINLTGTKTSSKKEVAPKKPKKR